MSTVRVGAYVFLADHFVRAHYEKPRTTIYTTTMDPIFVYADVRDQIVEQLQASREPPRKRLRTEPPRIVVHVEGGAEPAEYRIKGGTELARLFSAHREAAGLPEAVTYYAADEPLAPEATPDAMGWRDEVTIRYRVAGPPESPP